MKVEILYLADCPSQPAAVSLVKEVLAAQGVEAEITELLVSDEQAARELRFPGSPTIRINGRDVAEPLATESFALRCRLYPGSSRIGLPPVELIRLAVAAAREGSKP
jgi:Domain of unknown function (DUF2703)